MAESGADPETVAVRIINRGLRLAEDVLYALIAVVLVASALVVLADAARTLLRAASHDPTPAIEATLSALLIVFILVELLGAVRTTVKERRLVAEPFLLVGMIASIKEIVVVGGFGDDDLTVEDTMLKIGVLGAVVVGLSVASYMLRRKEREPSE